MNHLIEPLEARIAPAALISIAGPNPFSEGDTGVKTVLFKVSLSEAAPAGGITVHYASKDGTATLADDDYTSVDGLLTFEEGSLEKTISVLVKGDIKGEADETFSVQLSNASTSASLDSAKSSADAIIQNDEAVISLSGPDVSNEGNAAHAVEFTVNLTKPAPAGGLTVRYTTSDGSAKSGGDASDYVAANQVLTFAEGETSKTFSITVNGDTRYEETQTFNVTLSEPTHSVLDPAKSSVAVVLSNDDALPTVSIVNLTPATGTSIAEGGTAKFEVKLSNQSDLPVTVSYTTGNGTAEAGSDYTAVSGTLVFLPGQDVKTIGVVTNNDTIYEPGVAETFTVAIASADQNATVPEAAGHATMSILSDDVKPSLSIGDVTIVEGTGAGASHAIFKVILSSPSTETVTVHRATLDGTASFESDYTALGDETLVFAPGETVKIVDVAITHDALGEPDETFSVHLSDVTNSTIARADATGTIVNDDAAFKIGNAVAIVEGNNGVREALFEVTLLSPGAETATVNYATKDGSATAGTDYTASTGTLTFLPARHDPAFPNDPTRMLPAETTKTISVPIVGDTLFETNETFTVELSGASGAGIVAAAKTGTGTITDDDSKPVVSIGNVTVQEGAVGETKLATFMVSLSNPSTEVVTVKVKTADGTAIGGTPDDKGDATSGDYVSVPITTLTFAPGETSVPFSVKVRGDTDAELAENFTALLSEVVNGTLGTATGTGTITNDKPVVAFKTTSSLVSVTEGSAPSAGGFASFVVELIGGGDSPVTVTYSTKDGTATSGDYTAAIDQTITFAKGETSKTISIAVRPDSIAEANEKFTLELKSATGAEILASRGTATGEILDDEPKVTISNPTVIEGSTGAPEAVFTVTLDKAAAGTVIHFATEDGSALKGLDYTETSGDLTFAANETTKTIRVPILADSTLESSETFKIKLTSSTLLEASATATIVDPTVSIDPVTVVEGVGGVKQAVFTAHLSAPLGRDVSAGYDTVNGTALAGSDFTAVLGGLISFAKGETTKTISIPIIDDSIHEGTETFGVKLSAVTAGGAGVSATNGIGTITDDDAAPRVSIDNQAVLEGSPSGITHADFIVRLSGPSSEAVTVVVSTSDGTATTGDNDYVSKTQTFTFAPGGPLTQIFSVDVLGDTRGEADETFSAKLSAPTGATLGAASEGSGTITNDDASLRISGPPVILEGGSSLFTVTLDHAPTGTVTVDYTTQAGTATEGTDYELSKGTLVFGPDELTKTITVKTKADTTAESDENFTVTLSGAQNAGIAVGTATGIITEKALLNIDDISLQEGDSGTVVKTFTVTRSGDLSKAVTVDWNTVDGTAKDGVSDGSASADYVAGQGTLSFAANETVKTISVTVNGDTFKEGTETFQVALSNAQNGAVIKGTGSVSILEDAGDSIFGISIKDAKVIEGDAGVTTSATFRVELSAAAAVPISFTAATIRGITSARPGTDYTELLPTTYTIPAGQTFIDVPVPVIGNNAFENGVTKTFGMELSAFEGNDAPVVGLDTKAMGFIYNDDMLISPDGRTVQYMDVDGDVATVKVSKGNLTGHLTFGAKSTVGGKQLQLIDLSGQSQFSHANLSVTARAAVDFPDASQGGLADGKVNVGWIKAVIPDQNLFRFTDGIDLGKVFIQGDLARIDSGDNFISSAVRKLEVGSFGAVSGTMPLSGGTVVPSTSLIISSVGKMIVHDDFAGALYIYGGKFGDIGSLNIGGTLGPVKAAVTGGTEYGLGLISFTGTLKSAAINSIVGGASANSAQILGDVNSGATIGKVSVTGAVIGGTADSSGLIQAISIGNISLGSLQGGSGLHSGTVIANGGRLGNVTVHGDVKGDTAGAASTSDELVVSGSIFASQGIGKVIVEGNLQGGVSPNSGSIQTNGNIASIVIGKNLVGGAGSLSGAIGFVASSSIRIDGDILGGTGNDSGGITAEGNLGKIVVNGDIKGGNSTVNKTLIRSGFIKAAQISSVTVGGDLVAGTDGTGVNAGRLAASGAILVSGGIGSLTIAGSVTGNEGFSALISADSFKSITLATHAGASVKFAEILAGYRDAFTVDSSGKLLGVARLGVALNSGAQIGKVLIGGTIEATDIVAGAVPGADGRFGTLDDGPKNASSPLLSRIASVIVKGSVTPTQSAYGIVAQRIDSVTVENNTQVIPQPGPQLAFVPIVDGSNWNAVQVISQ
ncbi:MAG: hypothetical protein JWL59_2156 [Chthoniobacteraceae bacterium]|nr:hypothetical protein [Chthoniobacteraceae bacterium]